MRAIGSVIVGYIVTAVLLVVLMLCGALAMGIDGIYRPDSYEITPTWAGASLAFGLIAAVVGGLVCVRVAGSKGPPRVLAGLMLVIGMGMAGWSATRQGPIAAPPARTPQTPLTEVAKNSVQPAWLGWANPVVGAVGVLIGSGGRSRRRAVSPVSTPR